MALPLRGETNVATRVHVKSIIHFSDRARGQIRSRWLHFTVFASAQMTHAPQGQDDISPGQGPASSARARPPPWVRDHDRSQ
ncbi:MAG: hypothetical protein D6753_17140 [Planctomycetota bacterium]|nr:MAG: hypothetical protein D6753_17140 [Planctomycetota bacterium]